MFEIDNFSLIYSDNRRQDDKNNPLAFFIEPVIDNKINESNFRIQKVCSEKSFDFIQFLKQPGNIQIIKQNEIQNRLIELSYQIKKMCLMGLGNILLINSNMSLEKYPFLEIIYKTDFLPKKHGILLYSSKHTPYDKPFIISGNINQPIIIPNPNLEKMYIKFKIEE